MGVSPEQNLVVKHTFLEYGSEEAPSPSNCTVARQRSWTEPAIVADIRYGAAEENESDGVSVEDVRLEPAFVVTTPEFSPWMHPTARQMPLLELEQGESWDCMPAAAWPEQYNNGGWWAPNPSDVGMGLMASYWSSLDSNQDPMRQMAAMQQMREPMVVETPDIAKRLAPIAEVPCQESVVHSMSPPAAKELRTTVMLKGLPDTYTRTMLLQLLDAAGFFGRLNFLYLPVDFKRERSLGYALINLVTPSEALRLGRHFEGFSNWCVAGGSMCTVAWCSPQQGLDAHVERYRNSPVMHESMPDEWRPILLNMGVPIAFPAPTLKIKAPKFKGRQQLLG